MSRRCPHSGQSGSATDRNGLDKSLQGRRFSAPSKALGPAPARAQPWVLTRLGWGGLTAWRALVRITRLWTGGPADSEGCALAKDCRRLSMASVRLVTCSDSRLVSDC